MRALESHKKTTRLRLEVGRVAPVDVMKIDVRLAEIEQQLSAVKGDRMALLAHVEGFGTYGLRSAVTYDEAHEGAWAAGFQATVPLYHGGAIRAKIRQAKIRKQQSQERLLAIRLQIRTDLEQVLARLTDSLEPDKSTSVDLPLKC